MVVTDILPI